MLSKVLDFSVSKRSSTSCPPSPLLILRDRSNTPGTYLLLQLQHRLLHLVKLLACGTAGSGSHRALGLLVVPWERRQAPVHLGGWRTSNPRDSIAKARPGQAEWRRNVRGIEAGDFTVFGSLAARPGSGERQREAPLHLGLSCFHLGISASSSFMCENINSGPLISAFPGGRLHQCDMIYIPLQGPMFTRHKLSPSSGTGTQVPGSRS